MPAVVPRQAVNPEQRLAGLVPIAVCLTMITTFHPQNLNRKVLQIPEISFKMGLFPDLFWEGYHRRI